ncbi:MAG: D-alanyl-D-alanine carboxypeptidase [Candidatus Pacebacteria bacterium]|nr:D-alanyl-D-alanine carboxypeptidase [Candidatus Paceibacterota bacterium]
MNIAINLTKKQVLGTLGILLISMGFYLGVQVVIYFNLQYERALFQGTDLNEVLGLNQQNPFEDLSLSAKAYLVWDVQEQKIVTSLNKEMQLPLASLTKLMTVYIASDDLKNNPSLTIQNNNLIKDGDAGLILGETWTLIDMIDFVLMSSSNDGASALASILSPFSQKLPQEDFIDKMNSKAREFGMVQSFFLNESGLDVNESISGAYGSAKDTVILLEKILKENYNLLEASTQKETLLSSDILTHQTQNTNIIIDKLPGVLASKTGFTDLAGGNLIMAFDIGIGHNIIISVLGSTKEERFSDMEKLFWASLENYQNIKTLK